MYTFKKSAMKYKDANGVMQDAGVMCSVNETDTTLTKSGVAADAKVTGDVINEINENLVKVRSIFEEEKDINILPPDSINAYISTTDGITIIDGVNYRCSVEKIDIDTDKLYVIVNPECQISGSGIIAFVQYDNNGNYIETVSGKITSVSEIYTFNLQNNTTSVRIWTNDRLELYDVCVSTESINVFESYIPKELKLIIKDECIKPNLVQYIRYTEQDLTDEQKEQVRENIGIDIVQTVGESETSVMSQKAVSDFFSKKNPPIELTMIAGKFAMETGQEGTYADAQRSDFIPVKEGEHYKVTTWAGVSVPAVVFYKDTPKLSVGQFKGTVGQVTEQTYFENLEFTIPSDVMYMVINAKEKVETFTPVVGLASSVHIKNIEEELSKYATLKDITIVNLGDSIFGQEVREERNPVSYLLSKYTGATVINCAFGGTRMTNRGSGVFDAFDFPSITSAIVAEDFTLQEETLASDNVGDDVIPYQYDRILPNLKAVDWSKVDVVTLNYGTNDYTANVPLETFKSTAIENIGALMSKYPHITFVLITPTWRFWYNADGTYMEDSTTRVNGGNNLVAFCEADEEVSESLNINLINAYNIGINQYNRAYYFPTNELDGTHHAENGRKRLAKYLASQLLSIV